MPSAAALLDPPAGARPNLRAELVAIGGRWSRAQYRLVHLAIDLDRSGEWVLDGSRTCAHWIATALDIEIATAREWLRIGRTLESLPIIDTAFADGRISYTKVRLLTRVATPDTETELEAIAERTPAGRLPHEIARWLARHEDPADTERRHWDARSLTWRTEPDGMVVGTLRLPPEQAAMPMAAIDAWIMQRTSPDPPTATQSAQNASADASRAPSVTNWPSIPQQRADGLIALLHHGGALVDTEIVLHVRADGATLDDGTPIAGSIVERIAPHSFISVLIHDAQRRPINASGRQRHPTRRQKRVVHERDQGCVDCGATTLLHHDHDPDFGITKHTLVGELRERCWTCHRARHAAQREG